MSNGTLVSNELSQSIQSRSFETEKTESTKPQLVNHSPEFKKRRAINWLTLGFTYSAMYMGRYNLTVAKNALGPLMGNQDFGMIFGIGTGVYAFSFLVNGPLVDKIGGKQGILIAALGGVRAQIRVCVHSAQSSSEVQVTKVSPSGRQLKSTRR